jgi:predicted porin
VSDDLNIKVNGMFLEGTGRLPAAAGGYQTNDDLVHVVAGVDYKLTDRWNLSFNYEGAFWRPRSATFGSPTTNPIWNYFTLGVGYNLGENASLNVLYQIIDADSKGVAALGAPNAGKNRGGVAATTLSIKF